MAEVKWIKLATDIFDNKKIRQIESMPEGESIIVIWLKLLCLAGNVNENGSLYFTPEIPYTEQMLATQFNRPLMTVQLALKTFMEFHMIDVIDDVLHVSAWEKYQNVDSLEKIKEQNRIRQSKWREKQKALPSNANSNDDSNVTVTLHNADRYKNIEKEIDTDTPYNPPKGKEDAFDRFWKVYPKKTGKQDARKAFKNVTVPVETLIEAVEKQKTWKQWTKDNGQFIPNPATWLRQGRWDDEDYTPTLGKKEYTVEGTFFDYDDE